MQEEGEGLEGVMEERRQQLSATCAAASLRQDESNEKRFEAGDQRFNQDLTKESFLVDHNRRLLYCWNHKASYWPPCVFTFVVSGCLQLLDVAFHKTGNRKGSRSGQPPARTSMKNVLRHMTRKAGVQDQRWNGSSLRRGAVASRKGIHEHPAGQVVTPLLRAAHTRPQTLISLRDSLRRVPQSCLKEGVGHLIIALCWWSFATNILKAALGSTDLSVQRQSGGRQAQSSGKSRLRLFLTARWQKLRSFVFDPIILVDSHVHFTTQFYRSVAKVVGIEVSSETVDGEVTWQHFAQYLLKTSPEKDVSEL